MQQINSYIFNYKIEKILGQNTNQARTTYLASDNNGKVVLKEFRFNAGGSWRSQRNLEKEFLILQKLNHPQIPKYIGHFETENAFYLVMEYIEAENLENRYLDRDTVWEIARQVLEILIYLETQKVVHKDIKPANLLWNGSSIYLVDFGFASDLSDRKPGVSSTFLGTSGFMPPETIFRQIVSPAGDLYSFGITLFCLLKQIRAEDILHFLDDENKLILDDIEISRGLKSWLLKLIETNYNLRYKSAAVAQSELIQKLEEKSVLNIDREYIPKLYTVGEVRQENIRIAYKNANSQLEIAEEKLASQKAKIKSYIIKITGTLLSIIPLVFIVYSFPTLIAFIVSLIKNIGLDKIQHFLGSIRTISALFGILVLPIGIMVDSIFPCLIFLIVIPSCSIFLAFTIETLTIIFQTSF